LFQAEDGIRVFHVTGVQTCALPIFFSTVFYLQPVRLIIGCCRGLAKYFLHKIIFLHLKMPTQAKKGIVRLIRSYVPMYFGLVFRSEERRVGTEGRLLL